MKIASLIALSALLGGCDALLNFDKLRNGDGNTDGGIDRPDLEGRDLYGVDLATPPPSDMAHGDLAGDDFAIGPITDAGCGKLAGGPYFDTTAFTDVVVSNDAGAANDIVQVGAGDFNGDGKLDVVYTHHNNVDNTMGVDVWMNAGNRAFNPATSSPYSIACTQPSSTDIESFPIVVTVADFNTDGKLDVVVGCAEVGNNDTSLGNLYFLQGAGNGTFAAPVAFTKQPRGVFSGIAIDIDNDTFPDLVITDYTGSPGITVYWGAATGFATQTTTTHQAVGDSPVMVTAGYLEEDAVPDLVVTSTGTSETDGAYYIVPRARMTNHQRAFTVSGSSITVAQEDDYALGGLLTRLNTDSAPDLVTIEGDDGFGDPGTMYTDIGDFADGTTTYGPLQSSAALHGTYPNQYAFVVGDLNCDGRDEVVVPYSDADTSGDAIDSFDIFTPDANGTLTNATTYSKDTNSSITGTVIGDFDNDHIRDVLFGVNGSNSGFLLRFMYGLGSPP